MARYYTNLTATTMRKLERIAMDASYELEQRGGIDIRRNDCEDFMEIDITAIQIMLEEAYRLGKEDGEKLGRMEA